MPDLFFAADIAAEKVPFVDQTDHVIDRIFIHGQTGIARFFEGFADLVHRGIFVHSVHVDARHENILYFEIVKFKRRTHELRFVLFERTAFLRFLDEREQFFVRHRFVFFQLEYLCQKEFEAVEDLAHRPQEPIENLHQGIEKETDLFGIYACKIFGRDLAEDKHHHREHRCGYRRCKVGIVLNELCEKDRTERRSGKVYDIVAD